MDYHLYRQNAAIVFVNEDRRILLSQKPGFPEYHLTQGGIDASETAEQAARREAREELGIRDEDMYFLSSLRDLIYYTWPEDIRALYPDSPFIGQAQRYFLATLSSSLEFDFETSLHPEVEKAWWGTPQELLDGTVSWKREAYEKALRGFHLL